MATINVKDAAGSTVALEKPLIPGQAAMAASRPVVIASDQSTVPVSVASVPSHAVTNAGTFAVQNNAATPAGTNVIGKVSVDQTTPGTTNLVAASQNGTWTVQPGNTANTTAWKVLVDSSQLSPLATTAQAMSAGFQLVDVPNNGTAARAAQLPAALGSAGGLKVDDLFGQYETVAVSQTAQVMGATGATGDYLAYVIVFPGTAACGVVTVLDNATTWGTFAGGGTTALPSLVPFRIDVGAYSTSGAWKITTGANVTAVGVGKFT